MDTEEHQGWTNRETWTASLYISQSERNLNDCLAAARACQRKQIKRQRLADNLLDWMQREADTRVRCPDFRGMVEASFGRVNWKEIADWLFRRLEEN